MTFVKGPWLTWKLALRVWMVSFGVTSFAFQAKAADPLPLEMTRRAEARIYSLVIPKFPEDLLRPGESLEVELRLRVDDRGQVQGVKVVSPPSQADQEVVEAAKYWFVLPEICINSKWTASEVRTRVLFSAEGSKRLVTLRDPSWYAIGEDFSYRPAFRPASGQAGDAVSAVQFREPRVVPQYPRSAIQRNITRGVVVANLQVDSTGKVTEVRHVFGWPSGVFEESVRGAVMRWEVDPEDEYVIARQPFGVCVEVNFSLR